MTNGVKGDNVLRAEAVSQRLSPSSHIDTDESFCGVQGAFFKKPPLPLGERKTCLQVAFLLAQLTKVLLRYFRRK